MSNSIAKNAYVVGIRGLCLNKAYYFLTLKTYHTNFTREDILQRADDIKLLWESSPIQTTYARRNEFQIVECARYFLSKVHEVLHPDYVPTEQDLLQMRMQTIGIIEYKFEMQKHTLVMVSRYF